MEIEDIVVEQPGGEALNEKPRCFKLWRAGVVGLQTTTQQSRHPNAQFTRPCTVHQTRSEAEKFALQKNIS